jgi:Tol biopolymer transport system component
MQTWLLIFKKCTNGNNSLESPFTHSYLSLMHIYLICIFMTFACINSCLAQQTPCNSLLYISSDSIFLKRTGFPDKFVAQGGAPSVSPNGEKIAYVVPNTSSEKRSIDIADISTGNKRQLTGMNACYPQWSPNGTRILIEYFDKGYPEIYLIDTSGKNLELLISKAQNPSWSPDSRYFAFVRGYDIYTFHLSDKKIRRLTNTADIEKFPAWSPDGIQLALVNRPKEIIETIDLTNGQRQTIAQTLSDHLSWTCDGELLYDCKTGIYIVNTPSQQTRKVTGISKDCYWPVSIPSLHYPVHTH